MIVMDKKPRKSTSEDTSKKRTRGRPRKNLFGVTTLHVEIDSRISKLIAMYADKQRFKPSMRELTELAYLTFLENEGYTLSMVPDTEADDDE